MWFGIRYAEKMILEHALVAKKLADTEEKKQQVTDELRTIRQEVRQYFATQDTLWKLAKPNLIGGRYPEAGEGLQEVGDKRQG